MASKKQNKNTNKNSSNTTAIKPLDKGRMSVPGVPKEWHPITQNQQDTYKQLTGKTLYTWRDVQAAKSAPGFKEKAKQQLNPVDELEKQTAKFNQKAKATYAKMKAENDAVSVEYNQQRDSINNKVNNLLGKAVKGASIDGLAKKDSSVMKKIDNTFAKYMQNRA